MKKAVLLVAALLATHAFADDASYRLLASSGFDFAAPSVSSTSAVANKQIGMIIFDASTNQFKGLDSSGSWDAMTIPGTSANVYSSSTGQDRLERAKIANNGTTASITSQSGNWLTSVSRTGLGTVQLTLTTAFSAIPTCTCTGFNDNNLCSFGTGTG